MSVLRVNKITDVNGDGPVEFTKGMNFPSNVSFADTTTSSTSIGLAVSSSTGIMSATTVYLGTANVSGICTGTFTGNAKLGITGLSGLTNAKTIALTLIT